MSLIKVERIRHFSVPNIFRFRGSEWVVGVFASEAGLKMSSLLSDVEDVRYVINFDYPNTAEDYIHRIGRTGRCLQSGTAYAFFTPNNQRQAKELISVLEEANQEVNPELIELANMARSNYGGKSILISIMSLCRACSSTSATP